MFYIEGIREILQQKDIFYAKEFNSVIACRYCKKR